MYAEIEILSWIIIAVVCIWTSIRIRLVSWPVSGLTLHVFIITTLLALGMLFSLVPYYTNLSQNVDVGFALIGDYFVLASMATTWMLVWELYCKPRKWSEYYFLIPAIGYTCVLAVTDFFITSAHPPLQQNGKNFVYFNSLWHVFFALSFSGFIFVGWHFLATTRKKKGIPKLRSFSWGAFFFLGGLTMLLGPVVNIKNRDTSLVFTGLLFIVLTVAFFVGRKLKKGR